jgi:hypothetical protein
MKLNGAIIVAKIGKSPRFYDFMEDFDFRDTKTEAVANVTN